LPLLSTSLYCLCVEKVNKLVKLNLYLEHAQKGLLMRLSKSLVGISCLTLSISLNCIPLHRWS
jgi:hypothetical protein